MNKIQERICEAFLALSQEKQLNQLQSEGVYIGKKANATSTSLLYQYQTIYVEVHYAVHRTKVETIVCHTETEILDRYAD